MSTWLVLPVKSIAHSKTRLACILSPSQREALTLRLLTHVLSQAAYFPGIDRTMVVSNCSVTLELARTLGVNTLCETGTGLNAAVAQARAELLIRNATRMLIIPLDLPLLQADDLRAMSTPPTEASTIIAPDRRGRGTNALSVGLSTDFAFAFGPDSFARHVDNARSTATDPIVVERAGLAFDVDTPDDFADLVRDHQFCIVTETIPAA